MHPALQVLQCRAILCIAIFWPLLGRSLQAQQCNAMSQPVVEGNTIIVLIVGGNSEQCSLARQWFTKPSPFFFFFCNCISLDNTKENCFFFCNGAILHSLTFTIAIEQQIALNCLLHSGQMSIQCNSDEFVFDVFVFVFSKYLYLYFLVLDKSLQQGWVQTNYCPVQFWLFDCTQS